MGHGDDVRSREAGAQLLTREPLDAGPAPASAPIAILPFGALGFWLFGSFLVLVGASQDEIRAALHLDLTRAGLLVSAVMSGIGVGVFGGGPLVDRVPRRPLFAAAAGLTGAALIAVAPGQGYWTVFGLLFLAGGGGGLYETILNAAAIEHYGQRSVRMVAILHSFSSVGAMLTPFGIAALVSWTDANDWTLAFRITGGAHLLLAAAAFAAALGSPTRAHGTGPSRPGARVLSVPLIFLCVATFAYVGVESAVTGLAIPYAEGALSLPPDRGRSAISLFWLGALAGRLAFALRSGQIDDARAASWMGGVAAAAFALGVGFGWGAIELLFAGIGFALGGVFPLLVALAGRRTPQAPATGIAVVAGLGSAGGFVTPWVTGSIGDATSIAFAMGTLAIWCVLIALAAALAEWTRDDLRGGEFPPPTGDVRP